MVPLGGLRHQYHRSPTCGTASRYRRPDAAAHDAPVSSAILRLASPILSLVLILSFNPPAVAASPGSFDLATLAQARTDLATLVNDERDGQGLVALRLDPEAMAIAEQRAETMAAMDVLSHTGPDGRTVFDAITAAGIPWFAAGEVLVWNNYPAEPESTGQAVSAWLDSPSHRSIILSSDYNYAGFGAAVSSKTGNRYYSGILLKRPDKTGGWTKAGPASLEVLDATSVRVTIRWTGSDTRLQVLTAGLRDFEVQRRVGAGSWRSLGLTTHTSLSVIVTRGRAHEFRVRLRDKAGNRGAWSSVSVTT